MFAGFTHELFEFFVAISMNNHRAFFEENRQVYERAIKRPLYQLAEALGPCLLSIDPGLEVRPLKVVSRIRRDTRFTRDKSPYRDHMWLTFRNRELAEGNAPCFYFDISAASCHFGMGFYGDHRPLMNVLRARLAKDARPFRKIVSPLLLKYELCGEEYKRLAIAPSVPEDMHTWYKRRGFYLEYTLPGGAMQGAGLVEAIARGYAELSPLYAYLVDCVKEVEASG